MYQATLAAQATDLRNVLLVDHVDSVSCTNQQDNAQVVEVMLLELRLRLGVLNQLLTLGCGTLLGQGQRTELVFEKQIFVVEVLGALT